MRTACSLIVWAAAAAAAAAAPGETSRIGPADLLAGAPTALSVTVYRAPYRGSGSIELDALGGFALVTETRSVHLPAGESRLRFEGVADGIEPASALLTGLGTAVLEKNRDAALLSPSALVAAAVGQTVVLTRTNPKTGKAEHVDATILSDAGGGVVFKTDAGIEALRCSGLPETFTFERTSNLASTPTLSVLVRSEQPISAQVTLSYLARGFDWAADYSATVARDGTHMDLGAWVTLANGNAVSFPAARTQVVAGRVNHESATVEPLELGAPILANCWPRGSTSDSPVIIRLKAGKRQSAVTETMIMPMAAAPALQEVAVAAQQVTQEQLGDLKLYRVPERTTVASRQSKQVRLLDRSAIPIDTVYGADLWSQDQAGPRPASKWLRTKNDSRSHLGLPLPSGRIAVFGLRGSAQLLEHESEVRDLAVDEQVEIDMGSVPDVQVDPSHNLGSHRVDIANARGDAIQFELRLLLPDGVRVVQADRRLSSKNGRPMFRLAIPARSRVSLHYQTDESAR